MAERDFKSSKPINSRDNSNTMTANNDTESNVTTRPQQGTKFKPLSGVDAVHINSAREMFQLHTRDRLPPKGHNSRDKNDNSFSSGRKSNMKLNEPKQMTRNGPNMASSIPGGVDSSFPRPETSKMASSSVSVPAKSHEGHCNNPQCDHCGAVIIPSPKSSFPIQDEPSITINNWSIYTIKKPILNSQELEDLETNRYDFPLPEMIFGNNLVRLVHEDTKATIEFNALDALDSLNPQADFKVSYHKEWLNSRRSNYLSSESLDAKAEKASKENANKDLTKLTDLETVKNYDWTYSPNYKGTVSDIEFTPSNQQVPIKKLLRPDPILFYDESILFEDELGDNGISMFSTKIRVMPTCLLLLCRFFLRIDNVVFRVRDVRIYIDFDSGLVLREYKHQNCPYDKLLNKLSVKNASDPKSILRDSNWVAQNIPVDFCSIEEWCPQKKEP